MKKSIEQEILKADYLMAGGKNEEANKILQGLLGQFPENKTVYADAVNIYVSGKMFDEAKRVFALYANRFGEQLRNDFSLKDVERDEHQYTTAKREYERSPVKVFRRMSIFERGCLGHLPKLFPVTEIQISKDELGIQKRGRYYRYSWSDVSDAFITSREGHKGGIFGEPIVRTLTLICAGETFRIDVSQRFPDFKDNELLLEELKKHMPLRESQEKIGTWQTWWETFT